MSIAVRRLWILVAVVLLATVAGWAFRQRQRWSLQMACYRMGAAVSYKAARSELPWFEREPDRDAKLRELMASFGTGNRQFDEYLMRYLHDPQCTDALRAAFSLELGWRPQVVQRWAAAWRDRKPNAAEEIASIRQYLDALHQAQPPRVLTWREVLDVQAAMHLTGQGELAHRLTPDNWRGSYERWIAAEPRWTSSPSVHPQPPQ